jgi:hypothetical protein
VTADRGNHTTPALYLRRFTDARGQVECLRKSSGRSERHNPANIGYINRFWGRDPMVRKWAEEKAAEIEAAAAEVLVDLEGRWPLSPGAPEDSRDWWAVAQLISLHIVRSPAWRIDMAVRLEKLIATNRIKSNPALFGDSVEELRSDGFMAGLLLDQAVQVVTLLGHLNWTLLRFPKDWLATSDQPIIAVPFLAPLGEVPILHDSGNYPSRLEFIWPSGPRDAILMTWRDAPNPDEPVDLGFAAAVYLNVAVKAQAREQVYWRPGSRPPFVRPPEVRSMARPLSPAMYPDYRMRTAIRSTAWREAQAAFARMVEEDEPGRIEILTKEAA